MVVINLFGGSLADRNFVSAGVCYELARVGVACSGLSVEGAAPLLPEDPLLDFAIKNWLLLDAAERGMEVAVSTKPLPLYTLQMAGPTQREFEIIVKHAWEKHANLSFYLGRGPFKDAAGYGFVADPGLRKLLLGWGILTDKVPETMAAPSVIASRALRQLPDRPPPTSRA